MRDGNFYFYNRHEDGQKVVCNQLIAAERAQQIVEASAGADVHSRGPVMFDAGDEIEFSFMAKWHEYDDFAVAA